MSDNGFLTSPRYLIGFTPAVSGTWCISILYGRIPHNTWTYVTFLLTGTFYWWIKNVFVPTGSSNHCYYFPSLLHIYFFHTLFVLPLEISLYYIAFAVVSKMTGAKCYNFIFVCLDNYILPNFLCAVFFSSVLLSNWIVQICFAVFAHSLLRYWCCPGFL